MGMHMAFIRKRGKSLRAKSRRVPEEYLKESEFELSKRQLGQQPDITPDRLRDEYYSSAQEPLGLTSETTYPASAASSSICRSFAPTRHPRSPANSSRTM